MHKCVAELLKIRVRGDENRFGAFAKYVEGLCARKKAGISHPNSKQD